MKEKKVEKKIDFQFTAVPMQLMTALDVNCRSMLFTLCQLSDYYADEQGVFFRTNADLSEQSKLSPKLVTATIDTLYSHNIIEVWSVGKGKGKDSNRYRLNLDKFKEYEKYSFDDLKNPELKIKTVKYRGNGYSPSYLKNDNKKISQELPKEEPIEIPKVPQSRNNIYNIETIYNIDNKEKEYNNTIYNMLEQGMTLEEVAKCLAPTNWDCFVYFKNKLKDNESTRQDYFNLSRVLSDLNYNFTPNWSS
jgi:hypothetical protein